MHVHRREVQLRHAVSLVHHQGDQLCIFRPEEEVRKNGVLQGCRLYFLLAMSGLGFGEHSYGQVVDADDLFRPTPGDYRYSDLTRRIYGLADRQMERAGSRARWFEFQVLSGTSSNLFWGGKLSGGILKSSSISQLTLPIFSWTCGRVTVRSLVGCLRPHLTDLPEPFHSLDPPCAW